METYDFNIQLFPAEMGFHNRSNDAWLIYSPEQNYNDDLMQDLLTQQTSDQFRTAQAAGPRFIILLTHTVI